MGDEGATPRELLLEACRRNNTNLLSEVFSAVSKSPSEKHSSTEQLAQLLNTATDGIGNHCLHLAATYGSYEVVDTLLDQEGLEVDPLDRLEEDTPLHKAVRFVNGLAKGEWEDGKAMVELLLDAGADPRIRNKAKMKPFELVDPRNTELRSILQKAEFAMMAGNDVVYEDGDEDGPTGSASDSE
ncbi:MAG: hypothetical protein M1830_008292 [Pleopsidium flavum]|nr:MAG: hypothetical protein M1830_008292 [Pleopsidium flavum]